MDGLSASEPSGDGSDKEVGDRLVALHDGVDYRRGEPMTHSAMKTLFETLEPRGRGVDQSAGLRIRIDGEQAERILSKGTAIDLSADSFPAGRSATTLIGHIAAQITRIGRDSFDLIVFRSFAESRWDDLPRINSEYLWCKILSQICMRCGLLTAYLAESFTLQIPRSRPFSILRASELKSGRFQVFREA
ncbi:hypothetical protein ABID26_007467 [Mesorhizobium shonense]|uniref:Uncharacterized protein n=1 Tax=Mesorhizobium shonense TaxID=1209948 RepID=A0ABV2I540_9HYPH